jgi:release factor glutamine methyltransferase
MKTDSDHTVSSVLASGTEQLRETGIADARLDAEVLLSEVLAKPRSFLYASGSERISSQDAEWYGSLIQRRRQRCPVSYLTGKKEFWSLEFRVDRSVLIPRPETELLVEEVLAIWDPRFRFVMDAGTGSGNIAVVLAKELPDALVLATDISDKALRIAHENARAHAVGRRIAFACSDLFSAFLPSVLSLKLDVLVSNPPYVAEGEFEALMPEVSGYEPKRALVPGPTGLECIERLLDESQSFFRPGGIVALEIGHGQGENVRALMAASDFEPLKTRKDFQGIERVVLGKKRLY